MRGLFLVLVLTFIPTLALGQSLCDDTSRSSDGKLRETRQGETVRLLAENRRARPRAVPASLVARQTIPAQESQPPVQESSADEEDDEYTPKEQPSLAHVSDAELSRRDDLERSGQRANWVLTDLDLVAYNQDGETIRTNCTCRAIRP